VALVPPTHTALSRASPMLDSYIGRSVVGSM
jgi:hypothetical protein